MQITYNKSRRRYEATSRFEERHILKDAGGWRWDPEAKRWWTNKQEAAAKLAAYADSDTRARLEGTTPDDIHRDKVPDSSEMAEKRVDTTRAVTNKMQRGEASIAPRSGKMYVLLDEEIFRKQRNAQQREFRHRVLHERGSSQRVTWNACRLLARGNSSAWWAHLVSLAKASNQHLLLPPGREEMPRLTLWELRPSPKTYLDASRTRMQNSGNAEWVKRSKSPMPVEGDSPIDIVLRSSQLLVYVITKWGYDISLHTKYDPARNQIARCIDCLIDQAQSDRLTPMLWMFVRDVRPNRAYSQLIQKYRSQPETLARELPHRRRSEVNEIAWNLSLIPWKEIVSAAAQILPSDDPSTRTAKEELLRRV